MSPGCQSKQETGECCAEDSFELPVPEDSQPGVSQFAVTPAKADCQLLVTLPPEWSPGDKLRVSKDDEKNWVVQLVQQSAQTKPRQLKLFIPAWAVPGESRFEVDTGGGEKLTVSPPAFSNPGDQMVFKYGSTGWNGMILKERLVRPQMPVMDCFRNMRPFRAPPMDPDTSFHELNAAVKAAGGFFSPKLNRACPPPLHIPGLVALETIDAGEVVARIPRRLHISASSAEAIAPKLAAELKALPDMQRDSRAERVLQGAVTAQFLHRAEMRATSRAGSDANGTSGLGDPLESASIEPEVLRVWDSYADYLLSVDFSSHRYFQAADDLEKLRADLEPSTQADFVLDMAGDMDGMYTTLKSQCSSELVGPAMQDAKLFVQARLSMATRVFEVQGGAAMLPLTDLFNHMPNPGVRWQFDSDADAMVYTALRQHSAGEEVFISYGSTSNLKLHQGYGFTLAPELEDSWNFELRPERVNSINEAYLPQSQWQVLISFDSRRLHNTLITALNEVKRNGKSPAEFLSLVCARCKAAYDRDSCLHSALEALKRVRARRAASHAWWEELGEDARGDACSDGIRVKMSEYLCLLAHLEAERCWRGVLQEEHCLEHGAGLRKLVRDGLQVLSDGHVLALTTKMIDDASS